MSPVFSAPTLCRNISCRQDRESITFLEPLSLAKVYADGNYAYYERFADDVLEVSKKNTQKIERKHLSLQTWCSRLVRKGIRFSKSLMMHKIAVGLAINVHFFGNTMLLQ